MMDVYSDTRMTSLYTEDMIRRHLGSQTFVADQAPEFSTLINRLTSKIVDAVSEWLRRNKIENELNALSNHMLDDVGIARWEIQTVARTWANMEVRRERLAKQTARAVRIAANAEADKAAKVKPYVPAIATPIVSVAVANDDHRNVAA